VLFLAVLLDYSVANNHAISLIVLVLPAVVFVK
jgi:hypothetical protein